MFCCTLTAASVGAIGVRSLASAVHVSGDGVVAPALKQGQVDPVLVYEVYYTLCVCVSGGIVPSKEFAGKLSSFLSV